MIAEDISLARRSAEPPLYDRFKSDFENKEWSDLERHEKERFDRKLNKLLYNIPRFWEKFSTERSIEEYFAMDGIEKLNCIDELKRKQEEYAEFDLPIPARWLKTQGNTKEKWEEASIDIQRRWTQALQQESQLVDEEAEEKHRRYRNLLARMNHVKKSVMQINEDLEKVPSISNNDLAHYLVLLEICNVSEFGLNGGKQAVKSLLRDKTVEVNNLAIN
jgi:hypothetical protein